MYGHRLDPYILNPSVHSTCPQSYSELPLGVVVTGHYDHLHITPLRPVARKVVVDLQCRFCKGFAARQYGYNAYADDYPGDRCYRCGRFLVAPSHIRTQVIRWCL